MLFVFPVLYFFYKSNYVSDTESFYFLGIDPYLLKCIFCEVVLYLIVLLFKNYKDVQFYILAISITVFPCFLRL